MPPILITAIELQTQLGKNTVVIDCRFNLMDKNQGLLQYCQGHVPGAYYFDLESDLSSPVQRHGGRHPLPDLNLLQEKLCRAGVNQYCSIVCYDDSRMAYAVPVTHDRKIAQNTKRVTVAVANVTVLGAHRFQLAILTCHKEHTTWRAIDADRIAQIIAQPEAAQADVVRNAQDDLVVGKARCECGA